MQSCGSEKIVDQHGKQRNDNMSEPLHKGPTPTRMVKIPFENTESGKVLKVEGPFAVHYLDKYGNDLLKDLGIQSMDVHLDAPSNSWFMLIKCASTHMTADELDTELKKRFGDSGIEI